MKKWRINLLAPCGATLTALIMLTNGAISARASLEMTIADGINTPVVISDNGTGDLAGTVDGAISWAGSIGAWNLSVDTGTTMPAFGSATDPRMSLVFYAQSTGAGSLTITFAGDGYGPLGVDTAGVYMNINDTLAQGTVDYSTLVNGSSTTAPQQGPLAFDVTTYGIASGLSSGTWAMSQTITINHTGKGLTTGDATLAVVPEPSTVFAGVLLLIPLGISTARIVQRNRGA